MNVEPSRSLREEQAELTRERILRTLVDLLQANGAEEISVPDVARRSGVSLRTVYRYFPTRDDLLDAGADWIFRRMFGDIPFERTIDDLPRIFHAASAQWDAHPALARAIALSPTGKALLRHRRAQRLAAITRAVEEAGPNLAAREQRKAAAVLGYLQSIRMWVTLHEEIGLDSEETTEAVEWALQTLIEDVRRRNRAAGRRKGGRQ